VVESAQHQPVHPALDVVRNVVQRFALAQARVRLIDKNRTSAQRVDARLERQAGTQRRLLEEQHKLFAGQHPPEILRTALQRRRQLQQTLGLAGLKIGHRNKIGGMRLELPLQIGGITLSSVGLVAI